MYKGKGPGAAVKFLGVLWSSNMCMTILLTKIYKSPCIQM